MAVSVIYFKYKSAKGRYTKLVLFIEILYKITEARRIEIIMQECGENHSNKNSKAHTI